MSDETTLLPCPFCGGEAKLFKGILGFWHVMCKDRDGCGVVPITNGADTETEAIEAWNTRAVETCEMYRDDSGIWHCKSCEGGADVLTGSDGELDAWNDAWHPNFCPNCGRKVMS